MQNQNSEKIQKSLITIEEDIVFHSTYLHDVHKIKQRLCDSITKKIKDLIFYEQTKIETNFGVKYSKIKAKINILKEDFFKNEN